METTEAAVIEKKVLKSIVIEKGISIREDKVIDTFSNPKLLKPYVEKIANAVKDDKFDVNTVPGRKEIGSRAHRVSKMKVALMKVGNDSLIDLKAKVKAATEGVKYVESSLNTLRDTTRSPLTIWDQQQAQIEKDRVETIRKNIDGIAELASLSGEDTVDEISCMIEAVDNIDCSEDFDEFAQDAMRAVTAAKDKLTNAMQDVIAANQKAESDRKLEKERKETQINNRLNKLRSIPLDLIGQSAENILKKLNSIKKFKVSKEEFDDKYDDAVADQKKIIEQLETMHKQAEKVESIPEPAVIIKEENIGNVDPVVSVSVKTSPISVALIPADSYETYPQSEGVHETSLSPEEMNSDSVISSLPDTSLVETEVSAEKANMVEMINYMYSTFNIYASVSEPLIKALMSNHVPCMTYTPSK